MRLGRDNKEALVRLVGNEDRHSARRGGFHRFLLSPSPVALFVYSCIVAVLLLEHLAMRNGLV